MKMHNFRWLAISRPIQRNKIHQIKLLVFNICNFNCMLGVVSTYCVIFLPFLHRYRLPWARLKTQLSNPPCHPPPMKKQCLASGQQTKKMATGHSLGSPAKHQTPHWLYITLHNNFPLYSIASNSTPHNITHSSTTHLICTVCALQEHSLSAA